MQMFPDVKLLKILHYNLKPLGDPDYQERVWIRREGKGVHDYDDATMYFMESCEEMFAHPDRFEGVNATIQKILQELYDKVCWFEEEIANHVPEGQDHKIIRTPEWREIQILATHAYEKILQDLKERNFSTDL